MRYFTSIIQFSLQRSLADDAAMFADFVPGLLVKMEQKLEASGLEDPECWPLATCEALRPSIKFKFATVGDAIREIYK